ncbi:MAG: 50S ribosomal protein L24 [Bacteroidota bacterium]|jgi:large subunit ribosomal protein L24
MSPKIKIKKGDLVTVIAGDSKGQTGKVLKVQIEKNKAIVEGVNLMTKHTKPNAQNSKGGILKKEAAIHISNLMINDSSGKPTRAGRKTDEKSGKLVRYSKNSEKMEVLK